MSGDITEGKNNSFDDYYKTDNLDDSELQARLYAEIYYESNIDSESRSMDAPKTIKFDDMANETNVESEKMHEPEEQLSVSETDKDSQKTHSTDQTEFTETNTLTDIEVNPAQGCDDKNLEDPSVMQGKENTENSFEKSISSKHTQNTHQESSQENHNDTAFSKYNVVSKCVKQKRLLAKQTDADKDSSDSEESIFEVPIPPKPNPPLIDLQDSDEENDSNSGVDKDDLILKKWKNNASVKTYSKMTPFRNCEFLIHRRIEEGPHNKNTVNPGIQTSMQKVPEDIVLNCTTIQIGAKSISEIKQLSGRVNQENKSTKDTNQNSKKTSPQNKSKQNNENANLQQETSVTLEKKLTQQMTQQNVNKHHTYNLRSIKQNETSEIATYINRRRIPISNQQKRYNDEVDSQPKQKRQCTIQQNNQDVMLQGNSDKEEKNVSNEFFEPMSEEMKNYYNSTHGQENFDVRELQQGMSKDPQMWAILDEDIMPCPRQPFRFWNVKCSNCHQNGHRRYDCPTLCKPPCCYMCGMKGHTESRCPQKMCLTCGKRQNTFRNTCENCRILYCTMCNSVGHEQDQCPDLWRRYHQTTDMSNAPQDPGNVMKPSKLLYCCNCAKRGHESSTCKEYRWSEHFPSPAVVTNYTDGPTYVPSSPRASSFSEPDSEFLSGVKKNETSIPQSVDVPTMTEDEKYYANIEILSNIDFGISQEAVGISEMDGNLKSSFITSIWPTVKTNLRQTKVTNVTFTRIIYSYGVFRNKNHKDARMILKNLTTFFQDRKSMYNNLINCKVAPVFLKTLSEKTMIEFEVKIGFTARKTLSLQLLAIKEYIEFLYDLLKYWLNLPDDEKDYGIDVTLPINPIKMFNLLNSRMPQLDKMHFTSYAEHIGGMDDPRWIYNFINNTKTKLKQYKGSQRDYNRIRRNLWRYQIKLLMIVNTEPSPNIFVRTFQNVMKRFQSERHLMGEKLDIVTYLRLILVYNQLFVPHTLERMTNKMLKRISIEEKRTNSLQIQQKPETAVHEQENVYNVYSSSVVSPPQNTTENYSRINNQQNNEMLVEQQNKNNTLLETNKTTDRNCDEREIIKDSFTQDPQFIPLNIELVSVQSENPERKNQLSNKIEEAMMTSNVPMNKQRINVNNTVRTIYLSRKQRKRAKEEKKKIQAYNMVFDQNSKHMYDTASNLIKCARSFKLPHMMTAADQMQKQVNSKTIKHKHIKTLSKLIHIEKAHQKRVNTYCETFK